MTIMSKALERVFEALEQDVTDFEAEDLGKGMKPNNEKGMTAAEKTQDAIRRTHSVTEAYERLFETICMSLGEVS